MRKLIFTMLLVIPLNIFCGVTLVKIEEYKKFEKELNSNWITVKDIRPINETHVIVEW